LAVSFRQSFEIGKYVLRQHLAGRRRYPLVLMLEPLFRCNLACAGCGKIDYPDSVLNARLTVDECIDAALECGAPVVSIAGGEPLLHREIDRITKGLLARNKVVFLCTNGLLLEKKLDLFEPHPLFNWQIHLDGGREEHDRAVCQEGVYDAAVKAIEAAKARGFRVNVNCTLFAGAHPAKVAAYLDEVYALGVDSVTISPGYAYERAPDTQHFLNRRNTRLLFRDIFRLGKNRKWRFNDSPLFLDFLAGNQDYRCTPWGNPTRNVFGWQRPCYLLNEGHARTFAELMDDTDWDTYGTGNYEKCADCMMHCGYEATAVTDMLKHPLKGLMVTLKGPRTEGPMAPDIPLDNQRPARDVYRDVVDGGLSKLEAEGRAKPTHRQAQRP
jgi:hopanoid biosynthesis associated radical SAM protein HpnH